MASQISLSGGRLTGPAKLKAVKGLLESLEKDLVNQSLKADEKNAALEELKIYGRNPTDADPIFTEEGIKTLTIYAFDSSSNTTCQNALRCLANALLLKAATRQIFVDLDYAAKACSRLKNDSHDDEFLVSRVLFLTTYGTDINLERLLNELDLADTVVLKLRRHASNYDPKAPHLNPMEEMAMIETLKLLFNITSFCPQGAHKFLPAVRPIVDILCKKEGTPQDPMSGSLGPLINSLINLDLDKDAEAIEAVFPSSGDMAVVDKMIKLLDLSITAYKNNDIEQHISPIVTVLRKLYDVATDHFKSVMQQHLLPSDEDREHVLGQTESLPSRLLRLSNSPVAPQASELISALLYDMSDKDPQKFVYNVGYGFASGYLFKHKIPVTKETLQGPSSGNDAAESSAAASRPINPVTGQRIDSEIPYMGPEMTRAEKEREAERLFVLFERLRATGVINAENPVTTAAQEGRLQELDSDDDSE